MMVRSGSTLKPFASQRSRHVSCRIGLVALVLGGLLIRPDNALPFLGLFESSEQGANQKPPAEVPPEYKGKQLPAGWSSDPAMLEAGKAIYEGKADPDINCADCHGLKGKPTSMGKGALDLTVAHGPDDEWFWRISEGVPHSKMRSWKKPLTEDQRWQIIAYLRTFAQRK